MSARRVWSWAKIRQAKGAAERRALKRLGLQAAQTSVVAQEGQTADDASGCEGRAAEVTSGPAPVQQKAAPHEAVKARQSRTTILPPPSGAMRSDRFAAPSRKIDISAAPSGMESAAERWRGKTEGPMQLAPVPVLDSGQAMCRCGSRASGGGRGPVPMWFGAKCIEAKCELRGKA